MSPDSGQPSSSDLAAAITPQLVLALTLLRRAKEAAAELRLDPWEFAVGLPELLAVGLTGTEVRWLVARGLADHALERIHPGATKRSFRRIANLTLPPQTCFVLTAEGEQLLQWWKARPTAGTAGPQAAVPFWDGARRQLWYRDKLVKWLRVPAASQETILAVFQEEDWPPRIDDPLGRVSGFDPHERLHEAVKGLNRGQVRRLLVFRRDGTGEGVTWKAREGQ